MLIDFVKIAQHRFLSSVPFYVVPKVAFCKNNLQQNEQLSCFSPVQCASHGPEGSIFVKTIFYKTNSYKLSIQRNSRMTMMVTRHIELMAGKVFLSTVHSRTNLENVHSFKMILYTEGNRRVSPQCALSCDSEGHLTLMCTFVFIRLPKNTK
jgi:hypothetical protein